MNNVVQAMLIYEYSAGEKIVRQGDMGDEFFIIKSGQVAITRDDAPGKDGL